MSALVEHEDLMRNKIENERWTHKEVSTLLTDKYPGHRGFSIRSLERFCSSKGIHKTTKIDYGELYEAVSTAANMVIN